MSEWDETNADGPFEVKEVLPSPVDAYHPVYVVQMAVRLRKHLRDADVVHSFITYPYLPAAAIALFGVTTPLFTSALGTYAVKPLRDPKTRWLLRYGYHRADEVLCISRYTEQRIIELAGTHRTSVVPLGVDIHHYGTTDSHDEGFILSVGAIKRRKGQDVLIRSFADIADDHPKIGLRFAGPVHDETYKDEIDALVSSAGLTDRVEFLGKVTEPLLRELYRDCTFFALTPRVIDDNFEGFGLVYLEAAAACKPSVGTRSGGVPTAVIDGTTGILADEDDVDGVAAALDQFLTDDELLKDYGRQARRRAETLTWDRYARELLNRFESAPR